MEKKVLSSTFERCGDKRRKHRPRFFNAGLIMNPLLAISVFLIFGTFLGEKAMAYTKMDVNCDKCEITFTFEAWAPKSVTEADIEQIKTAAAKFWNPNPKHKYFNCDVNVIVNIISERKRKQKPTDSVFVIQGTDPKGGGATLQRGTSGGKGNTPSAKSQISIARLPNGKLKLKTIAHEIGHGMGIDDLKPTVPWDRNGIKRHHIKKIIEKMTFKLKDGREVGWGADASCCKECKTQKKKKGSTARYLGQPRVFISGKVYSKETTLATVRGPVGSLQGHVIEVKTPTETARIEPDEDGRALIDWAALTTGLAEVTTATINVLDPRGRKIASEETTIEPGEPLPISGPPIIQDPIKWVMTNEPFVIRCDNCGLDADAFVGTEMLETLAKSASELLVFVNQPVGDGTLFVANEFGVSNSIDVHFYEITIPPFKTVIKAGETIPIRIHYRGLPVGCQFVVTNFTPDTISLRTSDPRVRQTGNIIRIPITNPEGTVNISALGLVGSTTGRSFRIQYYVEFAEVIN